MHDEQDMIFDFPATDARETETKKRTLYDISADYTDLEQLMDSIEDDISPEEADQIDVFIQQLDRDRDTKLENYGGLIKEWEARGKARQEEGKRIQRLGEVDLNKAKFLKGRLLNFFTIHNIFDAVQTLRFKFKRQKNGGVAPLVIRQEWIDNPESLPEQFIKRVSMPDTAVIRAALESGDDETRNLLVGIAHIGERGEHLRIS